VDLKKLKDQLAHTTQEFEQAIAHANRCDGAIQILKHLINELETGIESAPETFADGTVDNAPAA
jgi:hypothetical protein